jgi:hypothetical protein
VAPVGVVVIDLGRHGGPGVALLWKCSMRRSSNFTVECQDSITALSRADPGRPIDWRIRVAVMVAVRRAR